MSTLLKSLAHGASSLLGEPVHEKFSETRNVQSVAKFKERIIAIYMLMMTKTEEFRCFQEAVPESVKPFLRQCSRQESQASHGSTHNMFLFQWSYKLFISFFFKFNRKGIS
jgi:hypothetical protein